MANKNIHICNNCGHIESEKSTIFLRVKNIAKSIFLIFLGVSAVFGILATYNSIQGINFDNPNRIISLGGVIATLDNIFLNFQSGSDVKELKQIALNITKDCKDDYCRSKELYDAILDIPYNFDNNGSPLNPLKTWKSQIADCDEASYLLISLLKTLKIKGIIQNSNNHSWAIIYLEDRMILADLTGYRWEELIS